MSEELLEIQFDPKTDITTKELSEIYLNLGTQGQAPKHIWIVITKKALESMPAGVRRYFSVRPAEPRKWRLYRFVRAWIMKP